MDGAIKANVDGAARGSLNLAGCGGVFGDFTTAVIGAFSLHLGSQTALVAELRACIHAVNIAAEKHWSHLWIETDSQLVTQAFHNSNLVPWRLRLDWEDCLHTCSKMKVFVSHIMQEGNQCADGLANYGVDHHVYAWWNHAPRFISCFLYIDRLGAPIYRFS